MTYSVAIFYALIWIGLVAAAASAQDGNILAGAKREGRVVWYTVAEESQQLAQEFENKYPFIKVEVVRSTVYPLLNRVLNEAAAGNYLFDVIRHATFTIGLPIQKGLVQVYDSAERAAFTAGWKDKQGYWTSTDDNYFVVGYNTRQVTAAEAPKDWDDLLLPKWRGRIGLDPDNHILYGALEQSWGRDRALAYFRRLAQQQIQFRTGNTLLSQLIVAGEYPLGFVYAHRVELLKSQGAPMEWVSTMNPIATTGGPLALAAKARNPNAGKLLIDFVLSREGQLHLRKYFRIPSRADLEPLSPKLDANQLRLLPSSPELAGREEDWRKQFRAIFGIQ
jgi:iron(III) transport system substrate-binding protein